LVSVGITRFGYIVEAVCPADAAMYAWQSTLVNVAPLPERYQKWFKGRWSTMHTGGPSVL
jgi:hypothetical protein